MPSLLETKGVPLDLQKFTWREMVQQPISKLDDDAFTRVKVILMNGIEMEAIRFQPVVSASHDAGSTSAVLMRIEWDRITELDAVRRVHSLSRLQSQTGRGEPCSIR